MNKIPRPTAFLGALWALRAVDSDLVMVNLCVTTAPAESYMSVSGGKGAKVQVVAICSLFIYIIRHRILNCTQ